MCFECCIYADLHARFGFLRSFKKTVVNSNGVPILPRSTSPSTIIFAVEGECFQKASTSCCSRRAAISQYRSSISIPIARRPKSFAARNVVPLPMKGSRMV